MYGLFMLICSALSCQYQPYGYVYPDEQNCLMDKETLTVKGISSECYLIDEIISADFAQTKS
ncbi:hypothetical protein AB7X32_19175 [Morganella morganii]|uniref:hypothetical protein n=1 Tax=Morganella morganii TaxID=582 RepID=UPI0034E47099